MLTEIASDACLAAADQAAPVLSGHSMTYGELRGEVSAQASLLRPELAPGESVLMRTAPTPIALVSYLACLRAGLVVVPVGPDLGSAELGKIVAETRPVARIGEFGVQAKALAAVADRRLELGSAARSRVPPPPPSARALVLYTSGTTAAPKGVVLSHRNLAANTASILAAVPLRRADTVAMVLSAHHSYGLSVIHTTLARGARLAPADFTLPAECVRQLAAAGATVFPGVPFHYEVLLGRSTGFDGVGLPTLRCAMVAGGRIPSAVLSELRRRFPAVGVNVMYGQTEASARLSVLSPSQLDRHPGSIGRGIPGVQLSVLGSNGQPVKTGEVGEIHARGDNVMVGYLGDPAATREVLTPHGLRTGDLAAVDAEGYIYVVGRHGDFVKVRGHRVSLPAIEEALEGCPGVAESVALGERDPAGRETIAAEVVLEPGLTAGNGLIAELERAIKRLPSPQRPRTIRRVDSILRTGSGKKVRWRPGGSAGDGDRVLLRGR